MNYNESVYEDNINFIDEDVEIVQTATIQNIKSLKISKNDRFAILAHGTGYRIFDFEQTDTLIIKDDISLGELSDIEFMDNTASYLLIALGDQIVEWDERQGFILKSFPILVKKSIHQLSYSPPFIVIGFDDHILVLNQKTSQAYRYIRYIGQLTVNSKFCTSKHYNNFSIGYLDQNGQNLILDNLIQQSIQGICIKDMSPLQTKQIQDWLQRHKQIDNKQFQQPPYPLYIAFSDNGNQFAVSAFTNQQLIYIYSVDWKTQPKLLHTLYRGQTKKELRIWFGPNNLLACFSYDPYIRSHRTDATLHLFFDLTDGNRSKRRYYFKTWAAQSNMVYRTRDILLSFIGSDQFRIVSGFNYYITQRYERNNNYTMDVLKDDEKKLWQHIFN